MRCLFLSLFLAILLININLPSTEAKNFALPNSECPKVIDPIDPPLPIEFHREKGDASAAFTAPEFGRMLLSDLNEGIKPEFLERTYKLNGHKMIDWLRRFDLTGDHLKEIIVAVNALRHFDDFSSGGSVLVFKCSYRRYEMTIFDYGVYSWVNDPLYTSDINADGRQDIIINKYWAGSATTVEPAIIGWDGNDFVDYFHAQLYSPDHRSAFSPARIVIENDPDNRTKRIRILANTSNSLGGGVPREAIFTYEWQGNGLVQVSRQLLPSPYRIHILADAQSAMDSGNITDALWRYEIAARDVELENARSYNAFESDSPFEYQTAFAYFRLVAIWLKLDYPHRADDVIEEMQNHYSQSEPGYEFVDLAKQLHIQFRNDQDPVVACQELTKYLVTIYPELDRHIGYWGYTNTSYFNDKICPFR